MPKIKKVLVAGGAGYIGSHMVTLLIDKGYEVSVFDNNYASHKGKLPKAAKKINGDLRHFDDISKAIKRGHYDLVMYFAGLIIAPESVVDPIKYYESNVLAAINLIKAAHQGNIKRLIFSSTAAVYGTPKKIPITESSELKPINPYGHTKLMFEQILSDLSTADKDFHFIALRYFNAAGAHASGEIGECHEPETHLIPNILKNIKGEIKELTLFGTDYPTIDGTCVRDYIHVQDLCDAHYLAIKALDKGIKNEFFNLGSGKGYSVQQIINEVEKATGKKVNVKIAPRRPGDPATLVASSAKAKKILGWSAKRDLSTIIKSAWAWEKNR